MYPFQLLVLLAFPLASLSNPLQVTLSCEGTRSDSRSGGHQAIRPAWEKENEQLIVPLTDLARKGDVDPATEEGLISTRKPQRGYLLVQHIRLITTSQSDRDLSMLCTPRMCLRVSPQMRVSSAS